MRVMREVPIVSTPAALWDLLWDVRRIVECVPGCVEAREIEPHRRYATRVTLDIGRRGEESLLRIDAEGRILGKLGALGHGVIQRKAEEAVDEFGARLQ